jgi:protein TonB
MKTVKRAPLFALALIGTVFASLATAQTVKHVTHAQAIEAATNKPTPEYSAMAKQLRVQGVVQVNAHIDEDGKIEKVEAVAGNPLLIKCAEDTLRKWKFNPFTDEGKPVKAVASLTFSFKL